MFTSEKAMAPDVNILTSHNKDWAVTPEYLAIIFIVRC